jgi:hypothetical protein
VDWPSTSGDAGAVDADLVRTFRIISAVGAASRAEVTADQRRGSRPLLVGAACVGALAAGKLLLAVAGAISGSSRVPLSVLSWPYALNVVLFGVAGTLLVAGGSRDRRLQALGLVFLVIGSAFADPMMPPAVGSVGGLWGGIVSAFWVIQADAFLALAFWVFVWLFPSEPKPVAARRVGRGFLAASAGVGVVLFTANVVGGLDIWASSTWPAGILRLLDPAAATPLYWPLLAALGAPAFLYLIWKSRVESTANRRRVRLLVGALLVGLTPMLLAVLLTPVIPVLQDPAWRGALGMLLYASLASIVPVTAYAVAVGHVMDVHLVLRRTIQYALARYSVWCAAIAPLLVLCVDIYRHQDLPVAEYVGGGRPFGLLGLSLGSFFLLTFRHDALRLVDRWFHRDTADYTEALARLEQGFRTTKSIRDISAVLKREIERAVHPTSVGVLIFDEGHGGLVSLESSVPPLGDGSALLQLLRSIRTEVQLSYRTDGPVAGLLPPRDRAWLTDTGFRLFSPLLGSTGTLLGAVGIGEGRNGLPYSDRDSMLMTAMSGQAALKLENSRLREQVGAPGTMHESATVDWQNEPAVRCPDCHEMWPPTTQHCSCGSSTVDAALPLVVKGKFRVERFIGSGGTGVVYRAVDMALDRKVAIKTLPAIRIKYAARLHREARAMATLLHPNLALIYGAEQWKGMPLLIFEYLDGGTLLDSLRRGAVALDEVIDLGTLLADALDRVHGAGVLHRDIKPSNIGYTAEGVPKLLDFGLAAILDRSRGVGEPPAVIPRDPEVIAELAWGTHPSASLTITQQLVGTPLYLSPEALAGLAPAPSFDLWSLSLVLYESFVGRHPLAGLSTAEVVRRLQRAEIPDVRDFRADCPAPFAAFLRDALSPVEARRAASAGELRTRLRSLRFSLFPRVS